MTKKSIWIICHYASPQKYGYGGRHFFLGEEFIKMGYSVTIFASTSNYQLNVKPSTGKVFTREIVNGVNLIWVKGINYTDPSGLKRVLSWFIFSFLLLFYRTTQSDKPDILIVSSLSLIPVVNGWLIKRRFPDCQFIFEIRDIWPQTLIDIGGYPKLHPLILLLGWFEKFGYKHADHIVATMPKADLHIRKRIKRAFNFTCIPQGIDLNSLEQTVGLSEEEKKKYFPESGFVVGYAGALGLSNSLGTLIEAARLIHKMSIDDIYFILVGDGNAKDDLMALAKDLNNVSFMPRIPKNKVQSFLRHCNILHDSVKPVPLYEYGLSRNKWMDYMISGKPLVVSYSGYVSLINEGECGTVVPAGDSEKLAEAIINYYHSGKSELERIGKNGRDFVLQHRTFGQLAAEYQKIFLS